MTEIPTNREAKLVSRIVRKARLFQEIAERQEDIRSIDEEMKGDKESAFSKVEIAATTDAAKLIVEDPDKRAKREAREEEKLSRKELADRLSGLADLPLGKVVVDREAA